MANEVTYVVINGYYYASYYCEDEKDNRLRYPTKVRVVNSINKKDQSRLDNIKSYINKYVAKANLHGIKVLKKELLDALDKEFRPGKKTKIIGNFIEDHKRMVIGMRAGEILKKDGGRYSKNSCDQFDRIRQKWELCAEDSTSKFKLNYNMDLSDFQKLLVWVNKKNYSKNTVYDIFNNLRIFLKWSFSEGYHGSNNYKLIGTALKIRPEESDAIAPTYEEILKLYNYSFKSKSQERARDLFVFGCFLALRVGDLRRINKYHLSGDVFEVFTQKGQKRVTIPCHWIAREIYQKYNGNIPTIARQPFSKHLTKICELAGINGKKLITITKGGVKEERYYERWDLISPHSMRRFYATFMLLVVGLAPEEIMPVTGHKTRESFFKYIKVENERNAMKILNHPAFQKPLISSNPSVER